MSRLNDHLVALSLLVARLVTERGLAPRGYRARTAYRGLALAAAVRMVVRVHNYAAHGRTDASVAGAACLAQVYVLLVYVGDLTYRSHAFNSYIANLAGRKSYLSELALFCHELSHVAGCTDELCAFAGMELDVVDERTYTDHVAIMHCSRGLSCSDHVAIMHYSLG